MNQAPKIVDTTLREGSLRTNHLILAEQIENICRELCDAGIEYVDASHYKGIGAKTVGYPALVDDVEYLKAAKKNAPKLNLVVFISNFPFSLEALPKCLGYFDVGRVGVNVHEAKESAEIFKILKKGKKKIFAHLMRSHAKGPKEAAAAAKTLADLGADVIYLSDTFGSFNTDDVKRFLEAIKNGTSLPLGFQGKNNLGLAMINSLAARDLGVEYFDASLMGMGQGSGVTPLETLVANFQKTGCAQALNLANLCMNAKFYALPAFKSLPYPREIDLRLTQHRLDYSPQQLIEIISEFIERPIAQLLEEIKQIRPDLVQLKEEDFREYLKKESIDLDILLEYLKTGSIPVYEES